MPWPNRLGGLDLKGFPREDLVKERLYFRKLFPGEHGLGVASLGIQNVDDDHGRSVAANLVYEPGNQAPGPRPTGGPSLKVLLGNGNDGKLGAGLPGATPLECPVQKKEVGPLENIEHQ